MNWSERTENAIHALLDSCRGQPEGEIRQRIRKANPYSPLSYHHRLWLKEVARIRKERSTDNGLHRSFHGCLKR